LPIAGEEQNGCVIWFAKVSEKEGFLAIPERRVAMIQVDWGHQTFGISFYP
jgi:hypothetical protein